MSAYRESAMRLVEDFINTYDTFLAEPEHLRTPSDLQRFLIDHNIPVVKQLNEDTLAEARQLRTQLRELWTAGDTEKAMRGLNALLAAKPFSAAFEFDGEGKLHLDLAVSHDLPTLHRLAAESALGIGFALGEYGSERLRACAAEPCRDVFIDTSRNGTRRFCSDRCANRHNTIAFRTRKRG